MKLMGDTSTSECREMPTKQWIFAIKIQSKPKKASQCSWVTNLIKIQYHKSDKQYAIAIKYS